MIKIICPQGHGATQFYRLGWQHAFNAVGHQFQIIPNDFPIPEQIFGRVEPDVLICGTWELTDKLMDCISLRPNLKLLLSAPNWGDMDSEIDTKNDTVQMASEDEKRRVTELKESGANLKNVFTYYHQNRVEHTHNHWKKLGVDPIGIPLAADIIDYPAGEPLVDWKSDIAFVGGYWPYKGLSLNRYIVPLCYPSENNKLAIRIYGPGRWPVPQHIGLINTENVRHLLRSATICPNIYEPLSVKYGFDVNERTYKILSSGGFCISEYVDSAAKDIFTKDEVVFVQTPSEFFERVHYFIKNPDARIPYIKRGVESVYKSHTYFNRIEVMCRLLGYEAEANEIRKVIDSIKVTI